MSEKWLLRYKLNKQTNAQKERENEIISIVASNH